ncbi:hypothetical protein PR048_022741 [Dryococelus australis]|uniref:Uncharacterized protein n=1 Tax=Dryococelus australis TaxID=614101 RepID=A0ABQ9GS63_9NEOP|nr:hypothetical protein PR048_022741 [Dryococelus australis]
MRSHYRDTSHHDAVCRPQPARRGKRVFNYRLSRARRIIEKYVWACMCVRNYIMKTCTEGISQYCPPGYVLEGEWRQQVDNNVSSARPGERWQEQPRKGYRELER